MNTKLTSIAFGLWLGAFLSVSVFADEATSTLATNSAPVTQSGGADMWVRRAPQLTPLALNHASIRAQPSFAASAL